MMVRENRAPLGTAFTVSIDARARHRARHLGHRPRHHHPHRDPRRRHARPTSSRPGTSSRCARAAAACWCAPARPRARSTSRGSPASPRPASSARSCATTAAWRGFPTSRHSPREHGLKIATIADLIALPQPRTTRWCTASPRRRSPRRYGGEFRALVYTTDIDDNEHLVLVKGDVGGPTSRCSCARTSSTCPATSSATRRATPGRCSHRAMERIDGRGTRRHPLPAARGPRARPLRRAGAAAAPARPARGFASPRSSIFRDFGIGAQILRDIGVRQDPLAHQQPAAAREPAGLRARDRRVGAARRSRRTRRVGGAAAPGSHRSSQVSRLR